jgi:DNA repair protein RadC
MSFEKLRSIKGVGKVKLGQVLALIEIAKRLNNSQEISIQSPEDVFRLMSNYLNSKKEHFVAFYLNTRLSLIKQELISIGILNASMVHPREVFEPAIRYLASSIIVAHNHPSGSLEPSSADIEVSVKLRESGKILGIELVDHIIVSKNGWYSFKDNQVVFN